MTAEGAAMADYVEFSWQRKVCLGDRWVLSALGSGLVKLELAPTTKKAWPDVTLADVLHVAELKGSIVSVCAIIEKGKSVAFSGNGCAIKMKDGRTVATGRRVGKLFLLDVWGHDDKKKRLIERR